jgi:diacylglycerol diphosphate phosphatase/phosphatidate phosphatase
MSHSTEIPPTTSPATNLIGQASDQLITSQREPHNDLEAASKTPSNPPYRRRNALSPGFNNPPPFKTFFLANYPDIITQFLCLGAAFFLYTYCPPIMPRYFPIYIGVRESEWGIKHGKPYITEYINTWVSAVSSFAVPALIMGAIGLWGTRSFEDGNAAVSIILSRQGEQGRTADSKCCSSQA